MDFFWVILGGVTAGSFAGQFMNGQGFGVIGDIVAGVSGALIAGVVIERTGFFAGSGLTGSLIVATSGAIVFLYGVRRVKKA